MRPYSTEGVKRRGAVFIVAFPLPPAPETASPPLKPLAVLLADEDRAESARAGADGHLGKPIQVESLMQALSRAVEAELSEPGNAEAQAR